MLSTTRPGLTPPHNPIDAFVRSVLEKRGLVAAPEADRRTLIRRVYFDLIGLPPSPEEIRAYLEDASDNAYERLVDRLLESPRHGERLARLWMDRPFRENPGHDQDRIRTAPGPTATTSSVVQRGQTLRAVHAGAGRG
jgi:hypothetical protein